VKSGFVCGHLGTRDDYQLAAALAEEDLLELLCTDLFIRKRWHHALARLGIIPSQRQSKLFRPSLVRNSWMAVLLQKVSGWIIPDPELKRLIPDRWLARILAKEARKQRAHLLTYEPWVVTRPTGGFPHGRKQVLFHFHPHVDREDAIYAEDQQRLPEYYRELKVTESPYRKRTTDAWRQADLILCASSFTRDSLVGAGMLKEMCRVVPYGVKPTTAGNGATRKGPLKLLFVGRNPLRKGLHHLLLAWRKAKKQNGDRLTIVCAAPERAVRELAGAQADVVWRESVSAEKLSRLYRETDALVVPSLCEGFGHVYLEAMGHGCAVVGTAHSALPDLGGEKEGVFMVPAGNVEKLTSLISLGSENPEIFRSCSEAARKKSAEFTWEKFRAGIREAVRPFV
jgi:glycosyltransferase involved in cell wall biosynthesis